ncbi:MAG: riboflavin synthase [Woeseia sp.]|nr:riboflavin synthase [Woeseia sp.]|tara:strand:- start:358 stop:999 length:642 start_codon:yes stop_codon:yes gene_type:complete
MFTGIVKAKGTVHHLQAAGADMRLRVFSEELDWTLFDSGESISVNGVCLTAIDIRDDGFDTDVSVETLSASALGDLPEGAEVNLEPSVAMGERLGGHLVTGHIDCVGQIRGLDRDARSVRLRVEVSSEFCRYIARKGSITVDGVSLTVNAVSENCFEVNIIPHTAEVTIISSYKVGTKVNIEIDLIARYLERLLSVDGKSSMNKDFLRANGYA